LLTRCGPLDVLGEIVGHRGYEELLPLSEIFDLEDGFDVRALAHDHLIEFKMELDRERDRAVLPILRRTLEERDRNSL
jgi:hypothetical protein